jgi:putative hemolysin
VTVAGVLSAAYGGSTLAPDLAPYLEHLGLGAAASEATALLLLTLFIAYLSLVLGELVPKRLAMQKSAGVSLAVAPILDRFASLMRPVIWLLSVSTNAVVRMLGGDPRAIGEQLSEEELKELVWTHEDLDEQERRTLRNVFAATETSLKEVMRPRGDVAFLPCDLPLTVAGERVRDLPYSRYPVTGDDFDDIIGFLHVRDLFGIAETDDRSLRDVCRPVLMLPGSKRVLPSVTTMREEGTHLAIVVDEYGGTDGIVTLEDLVEELVGEIRDEYDAADTVTSDDPASLDGETTLEGFTEATGIELEDGGYETVAGFVIARLGRIAEVGDVVEIDGGHLEVTAISGSRITAVAFAPRPSVGGDAEG